MESQEGSPVIEQAERNALGTTTYEKAEVVHRFADTHPWFHQTLIVTGLVCVLGIVWFVWRARKNKTAL